MYKWLPFMLATLLAPELAAQDGDAGLTRAAQIRAERLTKAGHLGFDKPSTAKKHFSRISDLIQHRPVRVGVGGLGPGAGILVGSEWKWNDSKDLIRSRLWGMASLDHFYTLGTGVELPHMAGRILSLTLEGSHTDAPRLEYYGPGPDSSIQQRTDYRREDTLFEFGVGLHAHRYLSSRCRLGELLLNVGPGTNKSLPSTETVFGPDEAPGIDIQSDYLIGGCGVQLDLRDFPGDPHKGVYAAGGYDRYFAQDNELFSFHRLYALAEQYIPFFNHTRVIAVRAKTELSFHSGNQVVPFYVQPTLASDEDLRGFRRYRFYDENSIAFNVEYRWEVSTRFDMALFVDSGKVFERPSEANFSDLETSAGFGFRLKSNRNIVARLDTGFSREGFQVWLKTGKLF